ncbi:flagellar motor switch protein FliM [Buchnera aphidicola (Macrosiphoniella sanborni)]|uniref:Flagellar motor switch protein FliM n=1 Tax=Buchnera aphidicola (Macrosiphoniella sanborni) TaxID=1241865 RepID=A0A4D6Y373_9GAMM|nr:FliM/FliN family flagellar motor switch protein [Buchnera aphidicola]QCI23647.1 flagellar motor switch protein FliM [Buchnera aphidicola (Macrosiphoniella sanborni)]
MGKSNNLNYKISECYVSEKNLKNFLQEDEVEILNKINHCFINDFISFLSNLIQKNIELVSCNFKIGTYDFNGRMINNLQCFNLLEISPYGEKSFIFFYNNFLSVIVDLLFGGIGDLKNKNKKTTHITNTDLIFNKKIIKFIASFFSNIYQKYFSTEVNFINKKIFFTNDIVNFNRNTIFLIKNFNLKIKNIDIFFDILIPKLIIQKININNHVQKNDYNNSIEINKNNISFQDIYDVELDIITKIESFSISKDQLYNLSKGDILPIKKPDKIIGYIENQPVFFADYKRFNKQYIIFIEEFINNNLELNQEKASFNE